MTQAKPGDTVHIHYTGKLSDGTQFDSSTGRAPLTFELGSGQIIKGLDDHVQGMAVGDKSTVTIPAEQAYGDPDPRNVQAVPREVMPDGVEIEVGMELQAQGAGGNPIPVRVTDVTRETVTVDANHPLAGEDLTFDVELVAIA